ncbi:alpha/beta hydrolase family protein [Frigoriflavimonas asaccharolytica]|uniref:AB hydrolase-1 domain-containing protein n=1 Tax=Frigoriflavimonas asaccharolytica TaxID=2735899 RepID=A0A8J8K4R0_9FLAO|nr:alpha/beta fold hydrolase [Frigoriflavimonas asaccharolytica]NRS92010.1 hypothetical protein [Frigoriflavimonas asaccharolytica]
MKAKLFICTIFLLFQNLFSQEITGTWYGNLQIQGTQLPLVFHIEKEGNAYKSTLDSPMQGAKGIAIKETKFENNELIFDANNLGIYYSGVFNNNKFEGTFRQSGMNLPLNLSRTDDEITNNRPQEPKSPFNYNNEDISFKNEIEGNNLAGTLTTPKNFDKSSPILVMITGSGAQNRDEELVGHKPFLVIADDFAKKGIATLRLDDRGIGGSSAGKHGATTADFATDINSAVNYLIKNGYKNIGLVGHSEGGMIAPMVAIKNKNVKFLVLMAGPGIPIEDLMRIQSENIAKISGASNVLIKINEKLNSDIYSFVKKYKGKDLKKDLKEFLIIELEKLPKPEKNTVSLEDLAEQQADEISSPWFRYFIEFNPSDYLSKIKIPVLAINGSLDLQVSAKENLDGIKKSLTKAGNKEFKIVELEGLNHLFQTTNTGNPSEYGQIEETFSPRALNEMTEWILKLK